MPRWHVAAGRDSRLPLARAHERLQPEAALRRLGAVLLAGKRERKVYSLTKPGREALQRWLAEPLDPLVLRHPMLLKLVFAAHADPGALAGILEGYARGVGVTRAEYAGRLRDDGILARALGPRGRDLAAVDRARPRLVRRRAEMDRAGAPNPRAICYRKGEDMEPKGKVTLVTGASNRALLVMGRIAPGLASRIMRDIGLRAGARALAET